MSVTPIGRIRELEDELRDRRACLAGAKQTLEVARDTLVSAESLDLARIYLDAQLEERIELVEEAMASTDRALGVRPGVPE